jgi:uncharacterized membrane protein YphA (DoxX/SURF4 family)
MRGKDPVVNEGALCVANYGSGDNPLTLLILFSDRINRTMPLRLLLPRIDSLYRSVCFHCHFGKLWQQQTLLILQTLAAILFTIGYQTRLMAIVSWYMYTSLILRNTWLYFILDRYFYYLLFYAMFLPLDERWSVAAMNRTKWALPNSINSKSTGTSSSGIYVNPATIAIKLLVLWIYLDAGVGKYMDPKKGWSYNADPLPALDTYVRHTVPAQYLYGMLGPEGLRWLTPTVVWVEILSAPVAFLGSFFGNAGVVNFAVGLIWQMHVGISLSIRNSVLLSYVACAAWCVFLPLGWNDEPRSSGDRTRSPNPRLRSQLGCLLTFAFVVSMVGGNIWFETIGTDCSTNSLRQIWSTLLQNRWNVFVGAEE